MVHPNCWKHLRSSCHLSPTLSAAPEIAHLSISPAIPFYFKFINTQINIFLILFHPALFLISEYNKRINIYFLKYKEIKPTIYWLKKNNFTKKRKNRRGYLLLNTKWVNITISNIPIKESVWVFSIDAFHHHYHH